MTPLVDEEVALRARGPVRARDPGALMVDVTVRACEPKGRKCRSTRTKGKVDTGAGRSYLPKNVVKKLHPKKLGKTAAFGVVGNAMVPTYGGVELGLPGHDVTLPRVLGFTGNRDYVLLGRDAMVGMDLSYDGSTGKFALKPKRGGKRRKR